MTYKSIFARVLALALALALLAGCGDAAAPAAETPQPTAEPEQTEGRPAAENGEIRVSTVDELLAAIAPNAVIVLEPGDYVLSDAAKYGRTVPGARWDWDLVAEGQYELIVSHADNLTIRGTDAAATRLLTEPRWGNLICFDGCRDLLLEGLTIGHVDGDACGAGVLRFERCERAKVLNCGLFGCGTVGLTASGCSDLELRGSRVYDCSDAAVSFEGCSAVRVTDCEISGIGTRESAASCLITAVGCDGFTVYDNRIHDNDSGKLFTCTYTRRAFFLSNELRGNRVGGAVFSLRQFPCVADGCGFADDNDFAAWMGQDSLAPIGPDGQALSAAALEGMSLRETDPDMPFPKLAGAVELAPGDSITVKTVDELLAAIGPDRTIVLEGALFDLTTAEAYGQGGSDWYCWVDGYDGPTLVIQNVTGLTICALSDDPAATALSAEPRYADVLRFKNCSELTLSGFTLGHTKKPAECMGGVLYLDNCDTVRIDNCRLYGCGVLGVQTTRCSGLTVTATEIFSCSQGAGIFDRTKGISFSDCYIHDLPSPAFNFWGCSDISWDGQPITDSSFDPKEG